MKPNRFSWRTACAGFGAGLSLFVLAGASARGQDFYVTFSGSSAVREYSSGGTVLASRSTGGTLYGVATDNAGDVLAVDLNGGVLDFAGGNLTGSYTTLSTTGTAPDYYGVATDASGNVYVTTDAVTGSSSDIKVFKYTGGAGNPALFSDTGANGSDSVRNTVAVDPLTGNVFVADFYQSKIYEYSAASPGTLLRTFTTGVNGPFGVAVDRLGNLYVSEYTSSTLEKIVIATGAASAVATNLTDVSGVAVDANNNVYVTNQVTGPSNHGSVAEFSPTGASLGEVFSTGSTEADYLAIYGVPEPGSIWLLALGGATLAVARRARGGVAS